MVDEAEYVELGLACADVCTALDRALNGRPLKDLNNSVCEATIQLKRWVTMAVHTLDTSLMSWAQPQDRRGDPEEYRQAG